MACSSWGMYPQKKTQSLGLKWSAHQCAQATDLSIRKISLPTAINSWQSMWGGWQMLVYSLLVVQSMTREHHIQWCAFIVRAGKGCEHGIARKRNATMVSTSADSLALGLWLQQQLLFLCTWSSWDTHWFLRCCFDSRKMHGKIVIGTRLRIPQSFQKLGTVFPQTLIFLLPRPPIFH